MGSNHTLVLHFNHFSGQLLGGYVMNRDTGAKTFVLRNAGEALAFLSAHPDARCDPLKV